jgi:hypothetical protein
MPGSNGPGRPHRTLSAATVISVVVALLLAATLMMGVLLGRSSAQSVDPVIAAAGDIACDPNSDFFNGGEGDSSHCRQLYTSDLLLGGVDAVLPLGDTQYENGVLSKFQASYDGSWGRVKSISKPAIGNHEYGSGSGSPVGSGYFDYFNGQGVTTGAAGDRTKGYYSFDIGSWHLVALNSVCSQVGGCGPGSPQEQWLRADLAAHSNACTLAYWHHPLFSSGGIGNNSSMEPIWQALYDAGADVVLSGHDHNYERFAPQDPSGAADPSYGVREFVVGTGGKSRLAWGTVKPNSLVRQNSTFGVLKLTLHADAYEWGFVPEPGKSFTDAGSGSCHGAPPGGVPSASTGAATAVSDTGATLNGTVNPKRQQTTYRFEYGPTIAYGSSTGEQTLPATDSTDHQVSANLIGLSNGTTYHFRIVATNPSGTTVGDDRAFTTGSAQSRYANAVLATSGLLGYWRLGEQSGTTAFDEKGSNAGTYRGGVTLLQPGALAGDFNTAARFDGTSGEMAVSGPSLSTVGSVEGWFYWEGGNALVRDQTSSPTYGWILAYDSGGSLKYRVAGKTFSTGRSTASVKNGWHHVVVTKNGGSVAFYLDGQLVNSGTGAPNSAATMPWHVMRNGAYATYAQGRADEVAVYGVALDGATVQQHYNAGRGL